MPLIIRELLVFANIKPAEYFMQKPILSFLAIAFLLACNHKKSSTRVNEQQEVVNTDSIETDTSSLISYKALKSAPLKEALSQTWKLDDASPKYWNTLLWDSAEDKRKYPELALFRDYSATENARCKIRFGKWKINKSRRELQLNFTDGSHETYFVKKILLQTLVLTKEMNGEEVEVTFLSDGLAQKQPADDPFYPSNNYWRIKPSKPESDEQILSRLKQCVHFYSLFFRDNHQRAATDISYTGLPVCFQWYNGGIGVPQELDLDKKWINCF